MNRKRGWWHVPVIFTASLILSFGSYLWLTRMDISRAFLMVVPVGVFVTSFLAGWLALNLARTFIFHNQGVQGYKLRGRITFFFILTNTASILIVGGVLFALILFIESAIIDKEKGIADAIVESYKELIIREKHAFEISLSDPARRTPETFGAAFAIRGESLDFLSVRDAGMRETVEKNMVTIRNYFARSSKRFFYPGETSGIVIFQEGTTYYAADIPDFLKDAFERSKRHMDDLYGLRILKNYIRPASILLLLAFSVPILIAVFLVSIALARSISQNLEKIARGTNLIALGNLDYRVDIRSRDEIEDLAANFNSMAEKLKLATGQIKRMERLEAWKEMARRLAHEIKNPLTPIRLSAERLQHTWGNRTNEFGAILDKTTNTIIGETRRLENLVNEFSQFARLPDPRPEKTDIAAVLREVTDLMQSASEHVPVVSSIQAGPLIAWVDGNQMKQVFINLLKNAVEASRGRSGSVELGLKKTSVSFTVTVRDHGAGIPTEIRERIFEPYFTTKENGSGLGLAIVERIVIEHGGYLDFDTGHEGTIFTVEIPLERAGGNLRPDESGS
jgi:signal transduction histidine kinase